MLQAGELKTLNDDVAKLILAARSGMSEPLQQLATAIEKIDDLDERKTFRRAFAEIVTTKYTDLELPIFRQFPSLTPDREPST